MEKNNVVSFCGSVVLIDVTVVLFLISVNVNLAFGPFNSIGEAQSWVDELNEIHEKNAHIDPNDEVKLFLGADGMPTRPFIEMHMSMAMVAEEKHARRLAKFLLSPDAPEEVEPMLAEYALRTANEAVAHSCFLLDKEK